MLYVAPTGAPVSVTAASVSSTSIRISWQAPVQELQNGDIVSYHITVLEVDTGRLLSFTTHSNDSIFVVNYLHPFYHYNCSVAAYTTGLGPSAYHVVQTLQDGETVADEMPCHKMTAFLNAHMQCLVNLPTL